jgi:uncharacterized cupredoxin-like copper-binding protein
MQKNRLFVAGAVLLGILALGMAGCGPRTATLDATLSDYKYTPAEWTVPAGATVTINLKNDGTSIHEWVLMKYGLEVSVPFSDDDEGNIFWEQEVEPGESATVTFTAPTQAGEYQIVCGTEGHVENGMIGKLTVTP